MKSDDLKMLSGEEKIDSKTDLRILSILISLIFLSNFSFAQIPINGFINFSEIKTLSQQNKLLSLNYNKDSYSDILLFNRENKTAYLLTGQPNLKFSDPLKLYFRFEPNFFKPIYNAQNQIIEYSFTSRKSRIFGLINFNQYGYPRISKTLKLNSYPNKIDIADVDLDNSNEYLISGEAFEGLSIVFEKNNQLVEKKYFKNYSFLDAFFININGDEYIDILAYDLISQNLLFIHNKDGDRFQIEKQLFISQDVKKFQIIDINFDSYKDLVFSTEKGLLIFLNDNLSVFGQPIFIKTVSSISNFIIGDFNHDGNFDFICHSSTGNYLSVIFAKNSKEYFEEIIFDFGNQIEELVPFFSRFVYGVASLSKDGKLKIVSEFISFNKDVNFIFGIKPTALQTFDLNNNDLLDFIFIDRYDNKLKLILRNNKGIPSQYYQIDLKGFHTEIFILRRSVNKVIFYCYSINERFVEIIEVDFNSFKFRKQFLYTEGRIQDLWSTSIKSSDEIKILYSKNNELNYGKLKLSLNNKYNLIKYPLVTNSFLYPNILNENENKIIYWNQTESLLTLNFVNYLIDSKQKKVLFSISYKKDFKIFNSISKHLKNYEYFSSFLQISDKKYLLIFSRDLNILIKSDLLTNYSLIDSRPIKSDNEGFLYFYDLELDKIFRIIYVKRLNKLIIKTVFEDVEVSDFIISKLEKFSKHLIFIDSNDQKIKIRQLD